MMNEQLQPSNDDIYLAQTTTALLRSSIVCLPFNLLFALVGIVSVLVVSQGFAVVHTLLVLWIVYLHLRIQFDGRIFKLLSGELSPQQFDEALSILGLRESKNHHIPLAQRCQGAVKLYKQLLWSTLAQGVLLLVMLFV